MEVYLQIWEESTEENISPDGASLHIDKVSLDKFAKLVYNRNQNAVPERYTRKVGDFSIVNVSDKLYEILLKNKSVKLEEYEFNNLVNLNDIKNAE